MRTDVKSSPQRQHFMLPAIAERIATELSTSRLLIRRLTLADAEAFFDVFSNVDVMRYWSSSPMMALVEAEKKIGDILEHYRKGDLFQFGIERKLDRQLIGTCTLHHIHEQNRRAEIGYALGRPYWGQGYMHEALLTLIGHAFRVAGLHRLEADIDPRNEASARSLERLGFQREGLLRERWIVDGEVSDSALYGLLASEWRERAP
jgi:RimJ/RimL family protein N-acetyltransferase